MRPIELSKHLSSHQGPRLERERDCGVHGRHAGQSGGRLLLQFRERHPHGPVQLQRPGKHVDQ